MPETILSSPPSVFTATSAFSLAGVAAIAIVATTAARTLLPNNARWQDRVAFIWLVRTRPRRNRFLFLFFCAQRAAI